MQTIHSRTYTNVALTVLIGLLLILALRPYVGVSRAYAFDNEEKGTAERDKTSYFNPNIDLSAAIREVAASNREIANAIRETSKAQQDVARSIAKLSEQAANK